MKVKCVHGYYFFEPLTSKDLSKFSNLFGVDLVRVDDYFTFRDLSELERYSISGNNYQAAVANKNFEGKPWEILEANDFIFDYRDLKVKMINEISESVSPRVNDFYFIETGLIVPGSRVGAMRIKSYSCNFKFDSGNFRYDWIGAN